MVPHESACNWSSPGSPGLVIAMTATPSDPSDDVDVEVMWPLRRLGGKTNLRFRLGIHGVLRDFYGFLRCFLGIFGVFKFKQEQKQLANTQHSVVLF